MAGFFNVLEGINILESFRKSIEPTLLPNNFVFPTMTAMVGLFQ